MPLIVPYCRMIPQAFSWKLRRAAECLSGHVGKWYNLAVFSGVIQNSHGAEVLRQAGCENFLTMVFSSPSGIKRAPGDLIFTPFVGLFSWTVYNYILYNYSNHHTSSEHGIERKTPHATRHTYASRAVKEGLPPEMLQKILGHADYSTTANIYTHIYAQTLVDAVTNTLLTNKK